MVKRITIEELIGKTEVTKVPNWKYPDFLEIQRKSFNDFIKKVVMGEENEGKENEIPKIQWGWFERLLKRFSPIEYGKWRLEFIDFAFEDIKVKIAGEERVLDPEECRYQGRDYAKAIRLKTRITNLETGESREDWVNMGTLPWMTERATFIVNGVERVIVNQIIRSPGIYLQTGEREWLASLIPETGTWVDVSLKERKQGNTSRTRFTITLDRKYKNIPVSLFMRAFGYVSDFAIKERLMKTLDSIEDPAMKGTIEHILQTNMEQDHIHEIWNIPSIYDRLVKILSGAEVVSDVSSSHYAIPAGTVLDERLLRKFLEHILSEQIKTGMFKLTVKVPVKNLREIRVSDLVGWRVVKDVIAGFVPGIPVPVPPEGCFTAFANDNFVFVCEDGVVDVVKGDYVFEIPDDEEVGYEIMVDGIYDEAGNKVFAFTRVEMDTAMISQGCNYFFNPEDQSIYVKCGEKVINAETGEKIEIGSNVIWQAGELKEEDIKRFEEIVVKSGNVEHIYLEVPWEHIVSDAAYISIYSLLNITTTAEMTHPREAKERVRRFLFDPQRNYLGEVALYRIARRFGHEIKENLTEEDLVEMFSLPLKLYAGLEKPDDIDHLGNRRVRAVGELIYTSLIQGFKVLVNRVVRDNMLSYTEDAIPKPSRFLSYRPLQKQLKLFFQGQLAHLLDDTNPLASLTHKRRVTALGPGGIPRQMAKGEVRNIHPSHYGRLCPIETPEGQNIGLINSLALYARLNEYGFIVEPYRKVKNGVVLDGDENIVWLDALEEEEEYIAPSDVDVKKVDGGWEIVPDVVVVRHKGKWVEVPKEQVTLMDAGANQMFSVTTSLIPFVNHNDTNRALMGSNMQRQAVPLIKPTAPRVGTGLERKVAMESGAAIVFKPERYPDSVAYVEYADSKRIVYREVPSDIVDVSECDEITCPKREIILTTFRRNNKDTATHYRPSVRKGDVVLPGGVLADSLHSQNGELALGKNLLVAFMPWEGYNYEDAILISRRLVRDDELTSIFIDEYTVEARRISTGSRRSRKGSSVMVEEITRDVPGLSDEEKRDLGEDGIVRIGAWVEPGSILVGKVTPQPDEKEEAEVKLLAHIFGEKIGRVKNTSLRMPPGERGVVIDVKVFEEDKGYDLPADVVKVVKVYVAQKRKIKEGDKLAGRYGNKGVVARILPEEDMPYLPDGTPVDVVLNPLGVPSRMNFGQVLETHLGLVARLLGINIEIPTFKSPSMEDMWKAIELANEKMKEKYGITMSSLGKFVLYDGRTGLPFEREVMVGEMHILKLIHMVDDKMHARATGPYALITQQPLGGKAHFGGQRVGEMEVWALEAYGAAYTLQEMLTIKSDDVEGRKKAYDAIVNGKPIEEMGEPESFRVLVKELQGLALAVEEIQFHKGKQQPKIGADEQIEE